jgi:hypothetical protein
MTAITLVRNFLCFEMKIRFQTIQKFKPKKSLHIETNKATYFLSLECAFDDDFIHPALDRSIGLIAI